MKTPAGAGLSVADVWARREDGRGVLWVDPYGEAHEMRIWVTEFQPGLLVLCDDTDDGWLLSVHPSHPCDVLIKAGRLRRKALRVNHDARQLRMWTGEYYALLRALRGLQGYVDLDLERKLREIVQRHRRLWS